MKSCSSPGGILRQHPRRSLRLIALTASITLLAVAALFLILLLGPSGTPSPDLTTVVTRIPPDLRPLAAGLVAAALAGIALLAWLYSTLTASLDRLTADGAAFARAMAAGRFNERLRSAEEGASLIPVRDLNRMAEELDRRVGGLGRACAPLPGITGQLDGATQQLAAAIHGRDAGNERAMAALEESTRFAETVTPAMEQLETALSMATRSHPELSAASRTLSICCHRLATWMEDTAATAAEISASGRDAGGEAARLLASASATCSALDHQESTTRQVEATAQNAVAVAEELTRHAEAGRRAAHEAAAGVQAVRDSARVTSLAMKNLWQRIEDIGVILSVIDEVAEQTDLLALNATIIAAQSGDQGRGFAVVADEIRELAERTSSSTREITVVIEAIQNETRRALDAMAQAETSIGTGQRLSRNSGALLEEIASGVRRCSAEIDAIASGVARQNRDSQAIRDSLRNVAEIARSLDTAWGARSQGDSRILASLERMRLLLEQARASQGEQGAVAARIQRALEGTAEPLERLRQARTLQRQESAKAAAALDAVRRSSATAAEGVKTVEGGIASLKRLLPQMRRELGGEGDAPRGTPDAT